MTPPRLLPRPKARSQSTGPTGPPAIISEADRAWLAAAIDGEGTIYIRYGPQKELRIAVVNTHMGFVQRAANLMGAAIEIHERQGFKKIYKARLCGHQRILSVLWAVLPYLIVKREKAEEVICFIESRRWGELTKEGYLAKAQASRRAWQDPERKALWAQRISVGLRRAWAKRKQS